MQSVDEHRSGGFAAATSVRRFARTLVVQYRQPHRLPAQTSGKLSVGHGGDAEPIVLGEWVEGPSTTRSHLAVDPALQPPGVLAKSPRNRGEAHLQIVKTVASADGNRPPTDEGSPRVALG